MRCSLRCAARGSRGRSAVKPASSIATTRPHAQTRSFGRTASAASASSRERPARSRASSSRGVKRRVRRSSPAGATTSSRLAGARAMRRHHGRARRDRRVLAARAATRSLRRRRTRHRPTARRARPATATLLGAASRGRRYDERRGAVACACSCASTIALSGSSSARTLVGSPSSTPSTYITASIVETYSAPARLPDPVLRWLGRGERVARQRLEHGLRLTHAARLRPRAVDDDQRDRPARRIAQDVARVGPGAAGSPAARDREHVAELFAWSTSCRRAATRSRQRKAAPSRGADRHVALARMCRITTRVASRAAAARRSNTPRRPPAAPADRPRNVYVCRHGHLGASMRASSHAAASDAFTLSAIDHGVGLAHQLDGERPAARARTRRAHRRRRAAPRRIVASYGGNAPAGSASTTRSSAAMRPSLENAGIARLAAADAASIQERRIERRRLARTGRRTRRALPTRRGRGTRNRRRAIGAVEHARDRRGARGRAAVDGSAPDRERVHVLGAERGQAANAVLAREASAISASNCQRGGFVGRAVHLVDPQRAGVVDVGVEVTVHERIEVTASRGSRRARR